MTNSIDDRTPRPQAEVTDDLDGAGTLYGRAGASVFSIGGPDGSGGTAAGGEPLRVAKRSARRVHGDGDRLPARRRKIPLSHVAVAVSYRHGGEGGRDSFQRSIRLEGNLGNEERAQLMQAANMCPVGQMLGLNADIRTNDDVGVGPATSYDDDLSELPIPNIYPD